MRKVLLNMFWLISAAITFSGCEKDVNNWETDPSHERLFRALVFAPTLVGDTHIEIGYTQVVSADRYIFEFSKDSLEFTKIVKTVEILADTLTPFAPSTTPTRVLYHTVFEGLDGLSRYSVRMKGINDETGIESEYVQFVFMTTAEQLFTPPDIGVSSITLHWPEDSEVTHIFIGDTLANGNKVDRIALSAENKSSGSIKISNLKPGTVYRLGLFNNDVQRSAMYVRTAGIAGGQVIAVKPGDDIKQIAENAVAAGNTDITFVFAGGSSYDLGSVTIPTGVTNVSMTGELTPDGTKPAIAMGQFSLTDATFGRVIFENLDITSNGAAFMIRQETAGTVVESYSFVNCDLSNYGSGVFRLNNAVTVGQVNFNNCFIHKNGGYGVVNIGNAGPAKVDSISMKNSTFVDLATQLMDVRAAVGKIVVQNNTFYNENASMAQLFRFDTGNSGKNLPLELIAANNIIAGKNNGAKMNGVSYDISSGALAVSFGGSYRTTEFEEERASRGFPNITLFDGTAEDLFVDPAIHDFHIKPNNGFGGRGMAGDPRWFDR